MRRFADGLSAIVVVLWVGGLWTSGYVVAPMLFAKLADRALAGHLAGDMFVLFAWLGLACGGYLLLYLTVCRGLSALRSQVFWIVAVMLLLVIAGHFGVRPVMASLKADAFPREVMETVLRDRFATWHGVASILHLIESALGVALVLKLRRGTL